MKTLAIIPARYGSTRFPGKPLVKIHGKTMIQRVYEKAKSANLIDQVVVATDDQRIYDQVLSFGGSVMMTADSHQTGTDRCGEVAELFSEYETIINLQGDEPFVPSEMIDELVTFFNQQSDIKIATLVKPIDSGEQLFSPHTVKCVFDKSGKALYFSRQAIPFQQGIPESDWLKNHDYYKHIGMYIFDRKTLLELVHLLPTSLERKEQLEQLRWLENGYAIGTGITSFESLSIDTPADLEKLM